MWPPALRAWRGFSLLVFLLPLLPAVLINLLTGQIRQLLGALLGLGLGGLAFRLLRRGDRRAEAAGAALVGVATGLIGLLAANLHPVAVILGLGAGWGARLAYLDPRPASPIAAAAPSAPDVLEAAAARIAALGRSAPRLVCRGWRRRWPPSAPCRPICASGQTGRRTRCAS